MSTTTLGHAHFSHGFCDTPSCASGGFAGYDGHEFWPTRADYDLQHHADGTVCRRYFGTCGQPDCPKVLPAKHAAPEQEPTLTGQLDEDLVTATDGTETAEMPRALFESTYSRFGWTLVAAEPDPQWPTEDPDQPAWPDTDPDDTGRGPFDAYLPAEEHA